MTKIEELCNAAILVILNTRASQLKLRSGEVVGMKLKIKEWNAIIGGDFNGHSYIWMDGRNQNAVVRLIETY